MEEETSSSTKTTKKGLILIPSTDHQLVHANQEGILRCWGSRAARGTPTPLPKSLHRTELVTKIKKNPSDWNVAVKADGERFFLHVGYFRRNANDGTAEDVYFSVLVDRKGCMYPIRLQCDDRRLFQGTLLDGELFRAKREFQVFDCVCAAGFPKRHVAYSKTLEFCAMVVQNIRCPGGRLSIVMKKPIAKCSRKKEVQKVLKAYEIMHAQGTADGLVFTREGRVLRSGPTDDMLKWKPDPTIDLGYDPATKQLCVGDVASAMPKLPTRWKPANKSLRLRLAEDAETRALVAGLRAPAILECNIQTRNLSTEFVVASGGKDPFQEKIDKIDRDDPVGRDEVVALKRRRVEVSKDETFLECVPIGIRSDKAWPNTEVVVADSILNKLEGLSFSELKTMILLYTTLGVIRHRWKIQSRLVQRVSSPVSGCKPRVTKSVVTALYRFHIFIFQRLSGWNFSA